MIETSFKNQIIAQNRALEGRQEKQVVTNEHYVHKRPIAGPFQDSLEGISLGLGCFWGAEKKFWNQDGVYTTAVGYSGGYTRNPVYDEVCSGLTGHSEVVRVIYNPKKITLKHILSIFWESHDPTQGMRQGNDSGTQYRSAIYCYDKKQLKDALFSKNLYQKQLKTYGYGEITTEVTLNKEFFYAEDYHQQYLAKNPNGYCGLGGTGIKYVHSLPNEI
jgi:peptide-methionine (S)-S-oxide reductase